MEHPKAVGERSTLATMLALREAGYRILLPFGENTRYDLVIDDGVRFARIQCKTGRLRQGAVRFKACSTYAHHPNPKIHRRDYVGEIDYFAVYCAETAAVYLVPVDEAPRDRGSLRVEAARNNQQRRIRPASLYELGQVAVRVTAAPGATAGAPGSCA